MAQIIKKIPFKYKLIFILSVVLLITGWRFKLSPLDFYFIELTPPSSEVITINFIPEVIFYDLFGNPVQNPSGLTGGSLSEFSKILLLLSLESKQSNSVKVKFISSKTLVSNGAESRQIHESNLGQEFILFPGRKITADTMNLSPTYLKEMSELNPNENLDLIISTNIEFPETKEQRKIDVTCKNNANLVNQNYENNGFIVYYPSCLVTANMSI